jgi:putative spermidine/putrescine transport system permease protein
MKDDVVSSVKKDTAERDPFFWMAAPATIYLLLAFVAPLALLLLGSFTDKAGFTLANYQRFFGDAYNLGVIWRTLKLGFITTAGALLIGYPLAFACAWARGGWQSLMIALLFLPLSVSIIVKVFGWMILFRGNGLVNQILIGLGLVDQPVRILFTETALYIGMINGFLPFMVLPIYSVVRGINPALNDAAATLGANPVRSFLRVTLPLSMPGVVAGSALVFSLTVSAYVSPTLLMGDRYEFLSTMIAKAFLYNHNPQFGSTVGVVLLAIALTVVVMSALLAPSAGRAER